MTYIKIGNYYSRVTSRRTFFPFGLTVLHTKTMWEQYLRSIVAHQPCDRQRPWLSTGTDRKSLSVRQEVTLNPRTRAQHQPVLHHHMVWQSVPVHCGDTEVNSEALGHGKMGHGRYWNLVLAVPSRQCHLQHPILYLAKEGSTVGKESLPRSQAMYWAPFV